MAWIEVHDEVSVDGKDGYKLCFQRCTYHWGEEIPAGGAMTLDDPGYRFIWRRANGAQIPSRGQAWIPSASVLDQLMKAAREAGWLV